MSGFRPLSPTARALWWQLDSLGPLTLRELVGSQEWRGYVRMLRAALAELHAGGYVRCDGDLVDAVYRSGSFPLLFRGPQ